MSLEYLLERVWGPEHSGNRRIVRTYVKRIRRKLGEDANNPEYIFNEPWVGYCKVRPDTPGEEME